MTDMRRYKILGVCLLAVLAIGWAVWQSGMPPDEQMSPQVGTRPSAIHSPYAGQESRDIKSLSPEDITDLQQGAGTALGGLAKLAELNGYPGPRHVLDAIQAGELTVSSEQQQTIQKLYDAMKPQAIALGSKLIEVEQALNQAFAEATITETDLKEKLEESARLYGELRFVHLKYHLAMMSLLTPDQVNSYRTLRGYDADPCQNIPEGHDNALWKLHNNCDA